MSTQRIVITDARGRPAEIEMWIDNHVSVYLRRLPEWGYPEYRHTPSSRWRALTLGAFGAQSGTLELTQGSGCAEYSRADGVILMAQLSRGVNERLVILKQSRLL